jgi:hypothetical protein
MIVLYHRVMQRCKPLLPSHVEIESTLLLFFVEPESEVEGGELALLDGDVEGGEAVVVDEVEVDAEGDESAGEEVGGEGVEGEVGEEDVEGVGAVRVQDVGGEAGAQEEVEGFVEFVFEDAEVEGTAVLLGEDVRVDEVEEVVHEVEEVAAEGETDGGGVF